MMGETIPKETNYVVSIQTQKDAWGMPLLKVNIDYDDNDEKMVKDYLEQMTEMYTRAGFTDIKTNDSNRRPDWIYMKWAVPEWGMIQRRPS